MGRSLRVWATLALAALPDPTAPGGTVVSGPDRIEIAGTPAGRGVECPLFRLDGGELITLTGEAPEGSARVVLSGRWQPRSPCRQGRTFRVESHRPATDG